MRVNISNALIFIHSLSICGAAGANMYFGPVTTKSDIQ